VFSFEICSTFEFLLFVSKAFSTQISLNLLDSSRLHVGFVTGRLGLEPTGARLCGDRADTTINATTCYGRRCHYY
jgi:hypothetical protein